LITKGRQRNLIIIIMGVSGSGKTTVGRELAQQTGAAFFEGDDFHSEANIAKMRSGHPLTEADRQPWLSSLRRVVEEWMAPGKLAVLACSALTEHSRQELGVGRAGVELVFLNGSPELIESRMRKRHHFMPPELLGSQFATLEPPKDALQLDVSLPVDELVARIRKALNL
jgi:gluconokinase